MTPRLNILGLLLIMGDNRISCTHLRWSWNFWFWNIVISWIIVHSCRLLVECPQKGNSLFGNSFEGTTSERHAPPPTWSHCMWAFKRLRIFKPVLSPPAGRYTGDRCDTGGKLFVVPWAWLSDVIPLPVFLIVSCLSWAFVYLFQPQKLGHFFYSLVLFYFSFMPRSVFTYFRTAYFLLHFLSPFLVPRLPASSVVVCCINFLIVCVFSVFFPVPVLSVDSSCVSLSSFSRFILFLHVEWCVHRPTLLCSNIYFKETQKTTERLIMVPALNCSISSFPVAGTWNQPLAAVGSRTYQDLSFVTNEANY